MKNEAIVNSVKGLQENINPWISKSAGFGSRGGSLNQVNGMVDLLLPAVKSEEFWLKEAILFHVECLSGESAQRSLKIQRKVPTFQPTPCGNFIENGLRRLRQTHLIPNELNSLTSKERKVCRYRQEKHLPKGLRQGLCQNGIAMRQ